MTGTRNSAPKSRICAPLASILEAHFATLKLELLEKRAATLDSEHERQTSRIQGIAETLAAFAATKPTSTVRSPRTAATASPP